MYFTLQPAVISTFNAQLVNYSIVLVYCQRWSPRGHILKSWALASRPEIFENWPVLGSRTALFFELLKFCGEPEKFLWRPFFWRAPALVSLVFGLEHSCPWPRECLSSEGLSLAKASDFFCVLGLEPCVLDSTSVYCYNKDLRIAIVGA